MNKEEFSKSEKKDFYNIFNNQVKKYTKDGTSLPQAISLVCKEYNLNPYKVIDRYYPEIKNKSKEQYKDVKTEEGSFVTLNNDSDQNNYEVININNKDAIVLRNTDNNEEITASENEITPVITENKMNKLNEAQYNISINGLETQDAATLSQMLSLADQAENVGGSMLAPEAMQNGMALNPMPMDMDSGLPMDMDNDMGMGSDMSMEEPVDDIEFDEELPADTEMSMDEPVEVDTEISTEEPIEDISSEESLPMDMDNDMGMDSDMSMDEPVEVDTEISMEEPIEDMSMDDMMDSGMYDNDIMGESFDYDALIKEALEAAKLEEAEETIPADEFINDEGQVDGEQEEFAEELAETNFDSEIAEALRLAGVQLNEEMVDFESDESVDDDTNKTNAAYEEAYVVWNNAGSYEEDLYGICVDVAEKYGVDADVIYNNIKQVEKDSIFDEDNIEDSEETNFDSEIAEALRLAGVQLNEEETNGPEVVNQKTLYINKDNEKEGQEPEYTEVDTTTFGKDASEGMKKSMTFEAAVNVKKIKSIYETAKSMYSKKDTSEWLSLDRRYVEKLIREGVGYEKASKMLMDAKKGK